MDIAYVEIRDRDKERLIGRIFIDPINNDQTKCLVTYTRSASRHQSHAGIMDVLPYRGDMSQADWVLAFLTRAIGALERTTTD